MLMEYGKTRLETKRNIEIGQRGGKEGKVAKENMETSSSPPSKR